MILRFVKLTCPAAEHVGSERLKAIQKCGYL
jgi:hypothetical protein